MHMSRRVLTWMALLASLAASLIGCKPTTPFYLHNDGDLSHYKGVATQIEYPDVESDRIADVAKANPPLTVINAEAREIWDLPLQEAIQAAVANSKVVRTVSGSFGNLSTTLANSSTVDPTRAWSPAVPPRPPADRPSMRRASSKAIRASVSRRPWRHSMPTCWRPAISTRRISRRTCKGSSRRSRRSCCNRISGRTKPRSARKSPPVVQVFFRNYTNFLQTNNPNVQFANSWTPYYEAEFTHPLLQGAGVQFNRIAGPNSFAGLNGNSSSPNVVPGNYNGVMIARINQDISLANWKSAVRNMVMGSRTLLLDACTTSIASSTPRWWAATAPCRPGEKSTPCTWKAPAAAKPRKKPRLAPSTSCSALRSKPP